MECIEVCFDCAQACADARLGEDVRMLARCIRLDLDCAGVCDTTGEMMSHQTAFDVEVARVVLQVRAEECERHAEHHEHCRVCVGTCCRCEQACNAVLSAIPA